MQKFLILLISRFRSGLSSCVFPVSEFETFMHPDLYTTLQNRISKRDIKIHRVADIYKHIVISQNLFIVITVRLIAFGTHRQMSSEVGIVFAKNIFFKKHWIIQIKKIFSWFVKQCQYDFFGSPKIKKKSKIRVTFINMPFIGEKMYWNLICFWRCF